MAARWSLFAGLAVFASWMLIAAGRSWERFDAAASGAAPQGVLPGEFEPCQGLLLAPPEDERQFNVVWDVIVQAHQHVKVHLLARDAVQYQVLENKLRQAKLADGSVQLLQVPFASPWVRDYGPFVVKSFVGGHEIVDFDYAQNHVMPSADRQLDDAMPSAVAAALKLPAVRVPLAVDGGNLLSNGAGLCVTTSTLQDVNAGLSWETIRQMMRERLGVRELVVLEPLAREHTRHVDMFCTFTAPDTIVIASCDAAVDHENAAILDRNARLLADVKTPCGPLKVVRLPTPPARDNFRWLSYTNVIYANGLLLLPTYEGVPADVEEQISDTYRRLLPGWEIKHIRAGPLLKGLGSLHCVAANLYGV